MLQDGQGVLGAQGAQLDTQGAHAPNVGGGVEVTELYNRAILEALLAIAQDVTTQANLNVVHGLMLRRALCHLGLETL